METKKKATGPVVDFEYMRALNEIINPDFLNKTLQNIRGGSVDKKDIVTYRINNTKFLANLYHDPALGGCMLLDSIFRMGDLTTLGEAFNKLEIAESSGGAKPKTTKPKPKPRQKKGGTENEIYQVPYDDVEELGGKKKTTRSKK